MNPRLTTITLHLKDGGIVEAEKMSPHYLNSKYKPEDVESIEFSSKPRKEYKPSFVSSFMRD